MAAWDLPILLISLATLSFYAAVTVTAVLAVLLPSCVVTVIVAEPAETPVTTPLALTEATAVLLDA
jgi:hypothetical protein